MPKSSAPLLFPPPSEGSAPFPQTVTLYRATQPPEAGKDVAPVAHYFWVLKRYCWRILAFVAVAVIATAIVSYRLTPFYESTAIVEVDSKTPPGVIGADSDAQLKNIDADQFLATQVKLLQSDSVIRPVVQRLGLPVSDLVTQQPRVPTTRSEDAPMILKQLQVSRSPGTYILLVSYRSVNPQLAADVANAVVQSYIHHVYSIRYEATASLSTFLEKQMEELKAHMEKSSAALAKFEKDLDVVNPDEKTSILAARLLQLNTEYTNAQADRVRKEAAFNSVKGDSLEAAEASSQGEELRRIEEHLNTAREKFASVQSQYGYNHPEYKKAKSEVTEIEGQMIAMNKKIRQRVAVEYQSATAREKMMQKNVAATRAEFDRINARSFEYKALKDEADSDKALYQQLIKKIREERVNASFQNSSIRLADRARPALKPVFPNIPLNALLAFICATVLAASAAILSDVLSDTLQDPGDIQRSLGIEVLAFLPSVHRWRGRQPLLAQPSHGTALAGRRRSPEVREFEEAIRTLRDSVLVPGFDKRVRSILISSASQREGKSLVAAQFALAHSRQKRHTLIIDGDMRRASVHRYLGGSNDKGLSTVVDGEADWRDVVRVHESSPALSIITAGPESAQAIDCVGAVLGGLLQEAIAEYDLVIIDTPPVGFAETLQMAAVVQGVLLVALPGETNRNAIANAVSSTRRVNTNIIGVALNEIDAAMRDRYYYYGNQGRYEYYGAALQQES